MGHHLQFPEQCRFAQSHFTGQFGNAKMLIAEILLDGFIQFPDEFLFH